MLRERPSHAAGPLTHHRPAVVSTAASHHLASPPRQPHTRACDVAVVGLGYVGLPTALSFTSRGLRVLGVDVSEARLEHIRSSEVDLLPRDLPRLERSLELRTLALTGEAGRAADADAVLICVPTPVDAHLAPDLTALRGACDAVVASARVGQTIILTSTTYVGTTHDLLVAPLESRGLRVGEDVFVAFSPERIDPGNSLSTQELLPRVVGGVTETCGDRAEKLLTQIAGKVHRVSSPEAAELTKLLENTFRAVNIALANEMATVGRELGVDVVEVIEAAATKPYGFLAFYPGPGVGGHCIPCDPHYLLWQLRAARVSTPLIEQTMASIASRPRAVVQRAVEVLADSGRSIHGARVAVYGVSYKPGVADIRESPALEILSRLRAAGADVCFHDPLVTQLRLEDATVLESVSLDEVARADLVVVHTAPTAEGAAALATHSCVLDATYRFTQAEHRLTV